jgi:hypothetical protein
MWIQETHPGLGHRHAKNDHKPSTTPFGQDEHASLPPSALVQNLLPSLDDAAARRAVQFNSPHLCLNTSITSTLRAC